ncbi:MAG: response regulator transcription factor [Gordonibacter sp.]|nr:response regulator transcription factor [Gordonibacter sp.]
MSESKTSAYEKQVAAEVLSGTLAAPDSVIRVGIVDDDPFVTTSLATILAAEPDVRVEGKGYDGDQAVSLYAREQPDVLLMDIQMPGTNGLVAAERILAAYCDARIVFLTTFSDDEYIVRALRLGAKGYLIKQEVATIAPALRTVMTGQSVLGNEVLDRVDVLMSRSGSAEECPTAQIGSPIGAFAMLSERELAVVELVAEGFDNKEIAASLYISEGTVRNYISLILQKLALKNRTQLAISYYRAR